MEQEAIPQARVLHLRGADGDDERRAVLVDIPRQRAFLVIPSKSKWHSFWLQG